MPTYHFPLRPLQLACLALSLLTPFVCLTEVHAQSEVAEMPGVVLGVEGTISATTQLGSFRGACGCDDVISSGKGSGLVIGLLIEHPVTTTLQLGFESGLSAMNTTSSKRLVDMAVLEYSNGQPNDTVGGVALREDVDVIARYIHFTPYLNYHVLGTGLFLQGGARIALLSSSSFRQTRSLVPQAGVPSDAHFPNGASSERIADGSIESPNSSRFSALLGLGWDIPISLLVVTPVVSYELPLNSISTANFDNWRMTNLGFSTAIKFPL